MEYDPMSMSQYALGRGKLAGYYSHPPVIQSQAPVQPQGPCFYTSMTIPSFVASFKKLIEETEDFDLSRLMLVIGPHEEATPVSKKRDNFNIPQESYTLLDVVYCGKSFTDKIHTFTITMGKGARADFVNKHLVKNKALMIHTLTESMFVDGNGEEKIYYNFRLVILDTQGVKTAKENYLKREQFEALPEMDEGKVNPYK